MRIISWRRSLAAAVVGASIIAAANPAEARHRSHQVRRHTHAVHQSSTAFDIAPISTAAGTIRVARDAAARFQGFISDVVSRGFRGPVHCYASGGHVRHSLHYSGHACDFAQRGWGKTVRPMYHVADLARKWGLRDGCEFRDCGHIDTGRNVRMAHR